MKKQRIYHYNAEYKTFKNARALRKNQTVAEKLFWKIVSNRKILGFKFRRQHPIGKYIVDFYCHEVLLVVELDGDVHDLERIKNYDERREAELKKLGLTITRFTNEEVFFDTDRTISELEKFVLNRKSGLPSPCPLPNGEGNASFSPGAGPRMREGTHTRNRCPLFNNTSHPNIVNCLLISSY